MKTGRRLEVTMKDGRTLGVLYQLPVAGFW
jgi:hypothetical protein